MKTVPNDIRCLDRCPLESLACMYLRKLKYTLFPLIVLTEMPQIMRTYKLSKRCRTRSDTTERGVWSESTPFAIHREILDTSASNKINLFKI